MESVNIVVLIEDNNIIDPSFLYLLNSLIASSDM